MEIVEILEHKKVSGDILYLVRVVNINAIGNNITKIWVRKHRIELFGDRNLIKRYNEKLEIEAELRENEEMQIQESDSVSYLPKKKKERKDFWKENSNSIFELEGAYSGNSSSRFNLRPKQKNHHLKSIQLRKSSTAKQPCKLKKHSDLFGFKHARSNVAPILNNCFVPEKINFNSSIINYTIESQDCSGYDLYRTHLNDLTNRLLKK